MCFFLDLVFECIFTQLMKHLHTFNWKTYCKKGYTKIYMFFLEDSILPGISLEICKVQPVFIAA